MRIWIALLGAGSVGAFLGYLIGRIHERERRFHRGGPIGRATTRLSIGTTKFDEAFRRTSEAFPPRRQHPGDRARGPLLAVKEGLADPRTSKIVSPSPGLRTPKAEAGP